MPINIKTGVLNYKNPTSGQYVGVDMITGDTSIVADDYSAQKTYLKDDYCIYNCKLYKAKQNIATAEAWNAAHWDETTVAAELTNAISPEVIADAVDDWLDDHPEATTTVADGSITKAKLDRSVVGKEKI